MDIERGIVEILFRYIPYSNVSIHDNFAPQNHDCMVVNKNAFLEQCRRVFPERSEDEWINAYLLTKENMSKNGGRPSVFTLISQLCEKLLVCHSSDVLCKFEQLFRWREISLSLGQDMLICCYLADYDLRHNIKRRNFSWLPVVMSDNQRIRAIFEKGIAENHFHLKGSARIFEINWICIMNNICGQEKNFKAIKKSLSCSSDGNKNFSTSFYDDCKLAALYRLYLFCELKGIKSQDLSKESQDLFNLIEEGSKLLGVYIKDVQDKIDYIKLLYGVQGKGGKTFDYALSKEVLIYSERKYDILLGERYFLYQCYRACFRNDFSRKTQNIFYQYLKLQVSFRNEMIQVNKNVGFKNFSDYEKRKTCFLDSHSKYFSEYIRSAIKYQADRKCLKSLEMRLTPATISNDIFKMLKKYDNIISEIQNDEKKNAIKYVMHFPKRPDVLSKLTFIGDKCTQPRNALIRKYTNKRVNALVKFINKGGDLANRIVGIDACASEIGCRPEVFGQVYRYLRNVDFEFSLGDVLSNDGYTQSKKLNFTYHIGEDFFDIADGLRAIDELLIFCGLERGNRLGHALALGINPYEYYKSKNYVLVISKQDLLDDIVWILCKSKEYGCKIQPDLKMKLDQWYIGLYDELYNFDENHDNPKACLSNVSPMKYYNSWKLRGDNPELYRYLYSDFQKRKSLIGKEITEWDKYAFNDNENVEEYIRNSKLYYELTHKYFFNKHVRQKGAEMENLKVDRPYADLIYQLQDCMIKILVNKGIAIETNPSSNYMIGTIKKYDQHPIVRFNSRKLKQAVPGMSLSVYINTDDQGVFDTLLENEYALMVLALEKAKDQEGNKLYDIEDIYEWLNYVREMGIEQSFE